MIKKIVAYILRICSKRKPTNIVEFSSPISRVIELSAPIISKEI